MKLNQLTKKSNKNIDFIFQHYPHKIQGKFSNTYFMKLLYTLLDRANDSPNMESEHYQTSTNRPQLDVGSFFDENIRKHIEATVYMCNVFKFKIDHTTITIEVYSENPIDINEYMQFFKTIMYLCCKNCDKPNAHYSFQLILTDYAKFLPVNEPIRPLHINTGYSIHSKNKVVLFRREEIIKVFIHECFHIFCLDFSDINGINYRDMFQPLFHVESDYLIFESLCEFWARTINAAIISYYTKPNATYKQFEKLLTINLNIERIYSMCKMKEYLSRFNLTYEDIIQGRPKEYKEETNGFCYYVLSSLLLFYNEQTMNWFIKNNDTLLQFKKKNDHIYLFYHYIKLMYKQPAFLKEIQSLTDYQFDNNLMSVFEILV